MEGQCKNSGKESPFETKDTTIIGPFLDFYYTIAQKGIG
ncbi:MAG: hypothetical protein Pg6B_06390 [Candidatus Azobacteroides pseudotrichonymphae]|jgi:hypothetical protein|nr:MAG: hypothetical protein Pg6B_06390 [Candidatus Azobacteroides pseudotrichonymphae]